MTRKSSVLSHHYDSDRMERQALFRVCCQSCDVHRFDCREAPVGAKLGAGPVLRARP